MNKKLGLNLDYLQLLSILLVGYNKKNIYFAKEFRLSNKDKDYLNFIYEQLRLLKNKPYSYQTIRRQLYFYNKDLTLDFLNVDWLMTELFYLSHSSLYKSLHEVL